MGEHILPDTIGYRKRIGVVVPSTNTTVQPETDRLLVPGVTCHTGRVTIKERPLDTEEAFQELDDRVGAMRPAFWPGLPEGWWRADRDQRRTGAALGRPAGA
jgi:hypothetical protein